MPDTPQYWIFLRGLGRRSLHWGAFPQQFRQAIPAAQIELLDLAGNGSEAARKSFLNIERYAADARQRSRFVAEGKAPFGILAISMGAMAAAAWAGRFPGEVARMVLINTSSRAEARFFERLRWRNYGTILRMFARSGDPLFRERCILQMTARGLPDLERIAQEFANLPGTAPGNFLRQMLASSRYSFPARPGCPVLFLVSEGDELVDPVCTRRLAARWRSPLRSCPYAGHDLPLMAPGWIVAQVEEFMGQADHPV